MITLRQAKKIAKENELHSLHKAGNDYCAIDKSGYIITLEDLTEPAPLPSWDYI